MKAHRLDQKALKRGKWAGLKKEPPVPSDKKRPVHKANLKAARVAVELDRKHPEPMSIMHKREKQGAIPERALPKGIASLGDIEKAASAMAAWDNSDPFSYSRTALHVKQGYLNANDVVSEMVKRTIARRVAKAREVDNAKA